MGWCYAPPTRRKGGIYCFDRIPSALALASAFISVHYLLNQLMDFDQTCIDTLFGNGKEMIRFWWPRLCFQGHRGTLKCQKYGFRALSSELVDGLWPNLHYIDTLFGGREELIRFWWPWPNFQDHNGFFKCPKYGFLSLILLHDGKVISVYTDKIVTTTVFSVFQKCPHPP